MTNKYLFNGEYHSQFEDTYMQSLGMDDQAIESVKNQRDFERRKALYKTAEILVGETLKVKLKAVVDEKAGICRAAHVAAGELVDQEYLLAKQQAMSWDENDEPPLCVVAWAEAMGISPVDAKQSILQTAQQWELLLEQIRYTRLTSKAAIDAAKTDDEALTAAESAVAALEQFGA